MNYAILLFGFGSLLYGLACIWLSTEGYSYLFYSWGWTYFIVLSWIFTLFSLFSGASFLISIGVYLGAVHYLGWAWWEAILLAFPSLIFVIPVMLFQFSSRHR